MLICALVTTALWLLLLWRGKRSKLLPDHKLILFIAESTTGIKRGQQTTRGKPARKLLTGRNGSNSSNSGNSINSSRSRQQHKPSSELVHAPAYALYELAKLEQRAMTLLHMLHSYLLQLHRYQWSFEGTVYLLNEAIGKAMLTLLLGSWLCFVAREWAIAGISLVISSVLILNLLQATKSLLAQRRKLMLLELPKLLTRLTLLVGAGDSVVQSFIKCARHTEMSEHPLYMEWNEAVHELKNGAAFSVVVEKLNRNCALQQMSLLTTLLLLNYRKGGEHFISSVHELNLSLWETRKTIARTKGEEASAKMIFPLVGILLLVMVLIVAPAIFMMQNM